MRRAYKRTVQQPGQRLLAQPGQLPEIPHVRFAFRQQFRLEIGQAGLLAPDERTGLLQAELIPEFFIEQFQGTFRRKLGWPQRVIRRPCQGSVVPVQDGIPVVHGLKEGNGLPRARRHEPFPADLQAQHQIQVGQPGLATAFPGQADTGTTFPDVGLQELKPFHPIIAAAGGMAVAGVVTDQARTGLVHVNAADAQVIKHRF